MRDTYTWQRPSLFTREKTILSSDNMSRKGYGRKGSVEKKKSLVVILTGFGAKTKWLAVNRQS
jgi:hypothetical protein